jgi:hypothetical protein
MDTDPDKALTVLELLEAEKKRRIEEKIAAGELRVVGRDPLEWLVVGSEEMIEEAVQRAEAEALNKYGNNPPLHCDFLVICTGVVRHGERCSPNAVPSCPRLSEEAPPKEESVEEPAEFVPVYCAPPQPPGTSSTASTRSPTARWC